jgi:hypothetical protein
MGLTDHQGLPISSGEFDAPEEAPFINDHLHKRDVVEDWIIVLPSLRYATVRTVMSRPMLTCLAPIGMTLNAARIDLSEKAGTVDNVERSYLRHYGITGCGGHGTSWAREYSATTRWAWKLWERHSGTLPSKSRRQLGTFDLSLNNCRGRMQPAR